MDRRQFLKAACAAPLLMIAPGVLAAAARPGQWDRILVLVELKGGNDGLNTVIPYEDAAYYQARPKLGVAREQALQLGGGGLGLNPAMESLMPLWQEGRVAIALGVGYPNPNRSHFRSIEIWETGSESGEYLQEGWLAHLFALHQPPAEMAADGVVLGRDDAGPLSGRKARVITMENPRQFIQQARQLAAAPGSAAGNPALERLMHVQGDIRHAVQTLGRAAEKPVALKTAFPKTNLGRQLEVAAGLLAAQTPLAVIKVSHTGFDNHANQRAQHDRLLKDLAEAVVAFEGAMREMGLWDRVLLMTYSEFGRRVAENDSAGTDHGTAAPQFLIGGRVKGGLYGAQPSLSQLDGGDLKHTLDFRELYAAVIQKWWGLPDGGLPGGREFRALDCLG